MYDQTLSVTLMLVKHTETSSKSLLFIVNCDYSWLWILPASSPKNCIVWLSMELVWSTDVDKGRLFWHLWLIKDAALICTIKQNWNLYCKLHWKFSHNAANLIGFWYLYKSFYVTGLYQLSFLVYGILLFLAVVKVILCNDSSLHRDIHNAV